MSEPDLSASTLRKQCVFLMLVSCHLCDVITWWEQKLSALQIVVLSHSPTQDKRNSELVAKRPCREVTCCKGSPVIRVWKQWTEEYRTTRKTGSGQRKVTSARGDRHLLRMAVNDRTASSRQLAECWSTVTGVLMSALSIHRRLWHRGLSARVLIYVIPLMANHQRLRLQWAHEHTTCGLTPEVMVWGAISYHGRSNVLRIEDNINSNWYVREVLQNDVVPFLPSRHRWRYVSA
ncbi:transposable element Tc1 transposase [Trichonephila clavipes]|nr:transposable element Tc1 transposase [Trichonephila clavipes]